MSERIYYRGSTINDFCNCPKKAWYRWFRFIRLEPKKRSNKLEIGDLTHQGCHLWFTHMNVPVEDRLQLIKSRFDSIQKDLFGEGEDPRIGTETFQQFIESRVLAMKLLQKQAEQYPTEDFEVILAEKTLYVCLIEELDIWLQATPDGLVKVGKNYLVLEHKTSNVSKGPMIAAYMVSPQIISYVWMYQQFILQTYGRGRVAGGLYNFLVKTKEPQIIRRPTLIGPGLTKRWLAGLLNVVVEIEEAKAKNYWPERLGKCHSLNGPCPYLPLCQYGETDTVLEEYDAVEEDPVREDYTAIS